MQFNTSHLHTDHVGDIAALWVGGWISGRYTPLQVYGPSGARPELGTKAHIDHILAAWEWFIKEAKGADVVVHECSFTPEQWMRIAGFPYKQAYWVTSQIHTPPEGFGKIMSAVEPRLAVAYHYWNHRDIEFDMLESIRKTYDGPLAMAADMTVINLTKDHIEVREVTYNHEAWEQGTSREWDTPPRGEPATGVMSEWLKEGTVKEMIVPPKEPME